MAGQSLPERLLKIHSPWLLNAYAISNIAAALFYGAIGASKMIEIIYFSKSMAKSITFENTIQLLDRSLMHSAIAGIALLGGHVMSRLAQISATNTAPPQWWERFWNNQGSP